MDTSGPSTNHIQSVLKALDVLECLAAAETPLSVRQVAQMCGFSRPTAYRLLSTLVSRDYVQQVAEGQYHLGSHVLSLGKSLLNRLQVPEVAREDLRRLSRLAGETAHLSVLDDTEILYLDKAESAPSVHMYCTIGSRNPLHNTAMGKAILAFLPGPWREELLSRITLAARTPYTITDREALLAELESVRERGYAVDDMENEEGIRCVGAPVFSHTGDVVAAISISGPSHRLSPARIAELGPQVLQTAQSISIKMGHLSSRKGGA